MSSYTKSNRLVQFAAVLQGLLDRLLDRGSSERLNMLRDELQSAAYEDLGVMATCSREDNASFGNDSGLSLPEPQSLNVFTGVMKSWIQDEEEQLILWRKHAWHLRREATEWQASLDEADREIVPWEIEEWFSARASLARELKEHFSQLGAVTTSLHRELLDEALRSVAWEDLAEEFLGELPPPDAPTDVVNQYFNKPF